MWRVGKPRAANKETTELRGSVLDVVRDRLDRGSTSAVLEVVTKLASRNQELEMLVAKMRAGRHTNERWRRSSSISSSTSSAPSRTARS